MTQTHFTPELFQFLLELRTNNNREWFQANKHRYERHVKEPILQFIQDFEPSLHSVSTRFVADVRANGGSMFRIYRDVRFSKDKSPYKTQAAAHFRHEAGKSAHAPGFYLHLAPGEVFAGVGIWHPDSSSLGKIRNVIASNPGKWERAAKDPRFPGRILHRRRVTQAPAQGLRPRPSVYRRPQAQGSHRFRGVRRGRRCLAGVPRRLRRRVPPGVAVHRIPHDRARPAVLMPSCYDAAIHVGFRVLDDGFRRKPE